MGSFWKSSIKDTAKNGTVLGGIMGAFVVWGDKVYNWIIQVIPDAWTTFAGDWSIPLIIIGIGIAIGYAVDKY